MRDDRKWPEDMLGGSTISAPECGTPRATCSHLPLKRGGIGGLRPPSLTTRTPMRSIGYVAKRPGGDHFRRCALIPTRLAALGDLPFSRGGGASGPTSSATQARVTRPA